MGGTILLLLITAGAQAQWTEQDRARRTTTLRQLARVAGEADEKRPPCAGLALLSAAALKIEPPRSGCPRTARNFEKVRQLDRVAQETCRDASRLAEGLANNRVLGRCESKDEQKKGLNQLQAWRSLLQRQAEESDPAAFESELAAESGEFGDPACAIPAQVLVGFRQRQLALAQRHLGTVDTVVSDSCRNLDSARQYLKR